MYCSGLFFSARWFVFSQAADPRTHVIILPDKETAEYCAADLYGLIEGDRVFYLPSSGKGIERSNYKSSLGVQRTAAVGQLLSGKEGLNVFVTFPEALEEKIPDPASIRSSVISLKAGDEIPYEELKEKLASGGFERVDFVSAPGQFAFRGSVVDIFSYSSSDTGLSGQPNRSLTAVPHTASRRRRASREASASGERNLTPSSYVSL